MTLNAYMAIHCCLHRGKISIVGVQKDFVVCPYCKTDEKVAENET